MPTDTADQGTYLRTHNILLLTIYPPQQAHNGKIQNCLLLLYVAIIIELCIHIVQAKAHSYIKNRIWYQPINLHIRHIMWKYEMACCFSIYAAIFIIPHSLCRRNRGGYRNALHLSVSQSLLVKVFHWVYTWTLVMESSSLSPADGSRGAYCFRLVRASIRSSIHNVKVFY